MPQPCPIMSATEWTSGTILVMDTGYARVSTAKQDLDRQIDALCQEGIASKYIYVDKKSGSTTNRPGLHKALDQAREGDIVVVHTLDRSDAPQAVAACTPYCYAGVRQNVSCKIESPLALFYTCLRGSRPYVYRKW